MTEITSYRCDHCSQIIVKPQDVMVITVRPSEHFSLDTETVHLCRTCGLTMIWLQWMPTFAKDDPRHPDNRGFDGPTGAE